MSRWAIYDKDGNERVVQWSADVSENVGEYAEPQLEYHGTWMGECFVTLTVKCAVPVDFHIGDYIVYRGEKFVINYDPTVVKRARRGTYGEGFTYDSIKFNALHNELTEVMFLDYVLGDNGLHYTSLPVFPFFAATIDDFCDRLQANTNRYCEKNGIAADDKWLFLTPALDRTRQRALSCGMSETEAVRRWNEAYGSGTSTDEIKTDVSVSISNQTIWNAMTMIKNSFGLNFINRGRSVIIGSAGLPTNHIFEYGKGNGLYEIERVADSEQQIVTKMYAYGNETNLPVRYYANIGVRCYARPTRMTFGSLTYYFLDMAWNEKLYCIEDTYAGVDGYRVVVSNNNGQSTTAHVADPSSLSGISEGASLDDLTVIVFANSDFEVPLNGQELNFDSGINKDQWPASHREYPENLPNNMAVNRLMLPGFPFKSLYEWVKEHGGTDCDDTTGKATWHGYTTYFSKDKYQPYVQSLNSDELGIREYAKTFDGSDGDEDIFPTIEGTGFDIIQSAKKIDDNGIFAEGDDEPTVTLTLPSFGTGFDLKEQAGLGDSPAIVMKDGYCGGRSFSFESANVTKNSNGTFTVKCKREHDDLLDLWFPYSYNKSKGQPSSTNEPYQVCAGDKYVLTGIPMTDTYVEANAVKLLEASLLWLSKNDYTRHTYLPKVDEIYMARQHDEYLRKETARSLYLTIKEGDLLRFMDEDLHIGDSMIFIDSLTIKEYGNAQIPTYDITLRNDKEVGTIERMQEQINSLTTGSSSRSGGSSGGGMTANQINNIIEGTGKKLFLSKLKDDTAIGVITFLKGLISKGNVVVNGLLTAYNAVMNTIKSSNYTGDGIADTGFRLTADHNGHSKLTIDEVYVRMKAVFESLEVRERTYTGGDQICSCAGNRIIHVDYLGNVETADHVPQMMNVHADGRPEGTGEGNVYSVPVPGDTYGYSDVKVPWLLRQMPLLARARVFARYRKVRIVLNEPAGSSANRAAASESTLANIRRARCYFLAKDDDMEVHNWWRINDLARCQTMNLANTTRQTYISGEDQKAGNIFWWRKVIGVSYEPVTLDDGKQYHYFDVSFDYLLEQEHPEEMATSVMEGSDIPAAQDSVVQFGNTIIEGRMNLMMMEVNGGDAVGYNPTTDAPCLKAYRGVYCFDLNKSWVGGKACKMKLSPKSGYEFYGPNFKQVTEYDVVPVPVDRGLWLDIVPTRDDYREHAMVRKCYYYDKASHNGSYWLCSIVDGAHWVDGNGDYISDATYSELTEEQKALCSRKQNYTIEEPSADSIDWTEVVSKGEEGNGISRVTRTYGISAQSTTESETTAPSDISLWSDNSPAVTEEQPYLWAKEVVEYTRSAATTKYYMMGARGDNGVDAKDVEWVYIRTKTNTAPVILNDKTYVDTNGKDYTADDHLPQVSGNSNIENNNSKYQCTDDPKGVNGTWKYEWEIKRSKGDAVDGRRSWDYYQGTMTLHNNLAESAFILDLDNQTDQFGTDSTGKVLVEQKRSTTATLYYGSQEQELTALAASLKYEDGTNVASGVASVTADKTTGVVEVTIKANNIIGYAEIIASITATCARGSKTITFPIQKVMSGAPGVNPVIYQLAPTQKAFSFGRDANDDLTPTSVSSKINVAKTEGNTTTILSTAQTGITYSWGFEDESSAASGHSGLAVGTNITVSSTDAANHTSVWVKLSTGDRDTLPITKDGAKGVAGDAAPYYVDDYGIGASRTSHSDISSWSSSQPSPTEQKPYVWKRSRLYNPNTQTYGDATYVCLTGETGKQGEDGYGLSLTPTSLILESVLNGSQELVNYVNNVITVRVMKGSIPVQLKCIVLTTASSHSSNISISDSNIPVNNAGTYSTVTLAGGINLNNGESGFFTVRVSSNDNMFLQDVRINFYVNRAATFAREIKNGIETAMGAQTVYDYDELGNVIKTAYQADIETSAKGLTQQFTEQISRAGATGANLFGFHKDVVFDTYAVPFIQGYGFVCNNHWNATDKTGRIWNLGLHGRLGYYTVKCLVKTSNSAGYVRLQMNWHDAVAGTQVSAGIKGVVYATASEWRELTATFLFNNKNEDHIGTMVPEGQSGSYVIGDINGYIDIGQITGSNDGTRIGVQNNRIYVRRLKIEYKDIATDFCEADEDVAYLGQGNVAKNLSWNPYNANYDSYPVSGTGRDDAYRVYVNLNQTAPWGYDGDNPRTSWDYINQSNVLKIKAGRCYTLSFWAKSSTSGFVITQYLFPNIITDIGSDLYVDASVGTIREGVMSDGCTNIQLSTTWKQYFVHFYAAVGNGESDNYYVNVIPLRIIKDLNGTRSGYVFMSDIELQEGYVTSAEYFASFISQNARRISLVQQSGTKLAGIDIQNGVVNLMGDRVVFTNSTGTISGKVWIDPNDGSIHASDGHFSGEVNATSGTFYNVTIASGDIGGFTVDADRLYNNNFAAGIDIDTSDGKHIKIGKNAEGVMGTEDTIIRIENTKAKSTSSTTYNTALYLSAAGAKYNYAFYGNGNGVLDGLVFGFKTQHIVIPSGSSDITRSLVLQDGSHIILDGSHTSGNILYNMPTLGDICNCLGIPFGSAPTKSFAIELDILNLSGYEHLYIGFKRSNTPSSAAGDLPVYFDNDGNVHYDIQLAQHDYIKILLVYNSNVRYRAYIIVYNA